MLRLRLAAVLSALSLLPIARASAGPAGGAHPFFDDSGTLAWTEDLATAQAQARASGKLIFIESGRRECHNCRVLVQRVLPSACLKARMGALCVGLASDCDRPDPRVTALFDRNLPGASVLPFVGFVTSDLQWVTGWAGGATADSVGTYLAKAEAYKPACQAPAPAPAPSPRSTGTLAAAPAPAPVPAPAPRPVADVAKTNLEKARTAAAAGQWGEVARLRAETERLAGRVDAAEWQALDAKTKTWCDQRLDAAVAAARGGKSDEAL